LSELFYSSGLKALTYFWYAEVKLYGNNEKWWPLLGTHYRKSTGEEVLEEFDYLRTSDGERGFKRPDFYEGFVKLSEDKNVLSVVSAVQKQFEGNQEHISPRPLFAVFDSSQYADNITLQGNLIKRADEIAELTEGRYLTLFSLDEITEMKNSQDKKEVHKSVTKYTMYVENLMRRYDFTLRIKNNSTIKGSLYPQKAWLYSIPIYEIRNGRQLMLATFIIFVNAPSQGLKSAEAKKRFRAVEKCLISLEVDATYLLSHRFYHDIDGYVPGTDPIVLLAHPGLSKEANLGALRMEGEDHHKTVFKAKFEKTDSILKRVYDRLFTTQAERNVTTIQSEAKSILASNTGIKSAMDEENLQEEHIKSLLWLKPLYAHQISRAHLPYQPSDNGEYHHRWSDLPSLCDLISMMDARLGADGKPFTRVHLYPIPNKEGGERLFHWPVEPGIRLLIPWMHMLLGIAANKESACTFMTILVMSGSISNWGKPACDIKFDCESYLIREWLKSQDTKKPRPNGLVAALNIPEKHGDPFRNERMARGWTRVLIDPLRRKGADTTQFRNLILGDVGAAMRDKGLVFPPSDPLFLPLERSMPIDVDIKASGNELLVAVTWQAIRAKNNESLKSGTKSPQTEEGE
jgi:hypothetical protein